MMQPPLTPSLRASRLIPPEECWEAMSRRASPRVSRRARIGNSSLANPSQIYGASLKQWLRADLGVTQSGTVSAQADQSGAGNNVQQPTGGARPTFLASGINGLADIQYSGAQWLYGTTTDIVTTALTAACVFKTSTLSASAEQPYGKGFATVQWLFAGASGGKLKAAINAAGAATSNAALNDNAVHIAVMTWDATVSSGLITLYIDKVAQTATGTTTGTISGSDTQGVGGEISGTPSAGASFFVGQIPEVLLVNRTSTAGELAALHAYLGARAGI